MCIINQPLFMCIINQPNFKVFCFFLLIDQYETSTPLKSGESLHPFPYSESPIIAAKNVAEIDADLTAPELPLNERYADCTHNF